jgi:hypothetical protein
MRKVQMVSKTAVKQIININMKDLIKTLKNLGNNVDEIDCAKQTKNEMIEQIDHIFIDE